VKNLSFVAAALLALAGCNLTYDREGLKFEPKNHSLDAEPNDTPPTALPLTLGIDVTGTIATGTDADYWVFSVGAGTEVRFQTFDANGTTCDVVDPKITIFRADGFSIEGSNDDGGLWYCEDLILTFLTAGTFYVRVEGSSWNDPPSDYLLRTTTAPAGGSYMSVSCNHDASSWCEQVTGTMTLAQRASYASSCGSTYAEAACPASTLSGYCDHGAYPTVSPDAIRLWEYYATGSSPYSQSGAETDCAWYGGTWIGGTTVTLAVTPLFPVNGANWNDWVSGTDWLTATDVACTAGSACVHAGQLRQVVVTGRTDCSGLAAADNRGAFSWTCDASRVGTDGAVRFVSTSLVPGKRLADLLDVYTPGHQSMSVSVWLGTALYGSSVPTAWWANPVYVVPPGGSMTSGASLGTIYVADGTVAPPYIINTSRTALVVPAGVYPGTVSYATDDVVQAVSVDFLWIEGDFNAEGANHGIHARFVDNSVLRNLTVTRTPVYGGGNVGLYLYQSGHNRVEGYASSGNPYGLYLDQATAAANTVEGATLTECDSACIHLQYAQGNLLRDVVATRGPSRSSFGVHLYGATFNQFEQLDLSGFDVGLRLGAGANDNVILGPAVAACTYGGVELSASDRNRIARLASSGNGGDGLRMDYSFGNSIGSPLIASNGGNGLFLIGSKDSRITYPTVVRNAGWGVSLQTGSDNNVLLGVAIHDNAWGGLRLTDSMNNLVADAVVAGNTGGGILSEGPSANRFTGLLKVGNALAYNCSVPTTPLPPPEVGIDGSCYPNGSSDHTRAPGDAFIDLSFVGLVQSDDAVNPSDAGGAATVFDLDAIGFDWTHFEHRFRVWGRDDVPIGSSLEGALGCVLTGYRQEPVCAGNGGAWRPDARITDWTPSVTDVVVRAVFAPPTLADVRLHSWYYEPAGGPFLLRGFERIGDELGDDDGLCESGETCQLAPNFGAYQGHGTNTAGAATTVGTVANVTFLSWTTNGR
jgi:hypothetical protein